MNTLNRIGLICVIIGIIAICFLFGYCIYIHCGLLATCSYSALIITVFGGCLISITSDSI